MALAEVAVIRAATAPKKPVSSSRAPVTNHSTLGGHVTQITGTAPLKGKLLGNVIKPDAIKGQSFPTKPLISFSWKTFAILAVIVIAVLALANR